MRFGLLGPVELADDAGQPVPVAGARLRVLLAALLLQANTPVPTEELAESLWDGAPAAARTLHSHVGRLRRLLGPQAGRLVARVPGYLIRVEPAELDVLEFERLCQAAAAALRAGAWESAADRAERALRLWRGQPLLDVPSQLLRDGVVPRFERMRVQVLEDRAEAGLHLGRHERLVPDLQELVQANPLRERPRGQLMLALYRGGRQAEALAVYQETRRVLVAELGTEPGAPLRQLHERILAGDRDLAAPRSPAAAAPGQPPAGAVPRQLPLAPRHFTGRHTELDLLSLLRPPGPAQAPGGAVISAIDGMAGIGKTTLAIHAAHRLAGDFPDGQLFLDLHGHTQGQRPRTAGQALAWLLRALGVPPAQIPKESEQAAALYRQRLAGTRTLIVLDNAATESQVRPLLPGAGSCLVLITSRRRLKGLDDARTLSLDLLPAPDAVTLLRAVAEVDDAPERELGEIAELCGYLPLALRIAAALLRHRPAWPLEHLAARLRDQRQRVPSLSDGERSLSAVFDLSCASLSARHRELWRDLGLMPGPDVDAYAAAALCGLDPATAGRLLEDLVDHNLLVCGAPGRYRLHDLIRAHLRDPVAGRPAPERDRAVDRLLGYYAATAQNASVHIARYPRAAPAGPAPAYAPVLPDPESARAWLRVERDNLEAASAYARASGLAGHAVALAAGLAEILRNDGPFTRAVELHQAAVDTARQHARPADHANALADLGIVRLLAADPAGAQAALRQALGIFRTNGHLQGEANALAELGVVLRVVGDLAAADTALNQALEIFRAIGHRDGEANALTELGHTRELIGDLAGAGDALKRALGIFRALGHLHGEANALTELGVVLRVAGDLAGADEALRRALRIFRRIGHRHGEAYALTELGTVRRLAGDHAAGADAHPRALEIFRALGHQHGEAWALNHYAATLAAAGRRPDALALYRQARTMNSELNKPDNEAVSLEGIAEHYLAVGDAAHGTAHLRQALEIYRRLGMALDARRVHDRLGSLAMSEPIYQH